MSSKADLSKAEEDLDNEAREDSQCRTQYGDAWKAKSSASLTMTMRKHIGPYKSSNFNLPFSIFLSEKTLKWQKRAMKLFRRTSKRKGNAWNAYLWPCVQNVFQNWSLEWSMQQNLSLKLSSPTFEVVTFNLF